MEFKITQTQKGQNLNHLLKINVQSQTYFFIKQQLELHSISEEKNNIEQIK